MALPLQVNNITFQYPEDVTDLQWGEDATGWAEAVTEVVKAFRAVSSDDIAQSGTIRLPNSDSISWRNGANSGDTSLFVNASNKLIFNDGSNTFDLTATVAGNVNNFSGAADNVVARYDGTTGQIIQDSGIVIDDSNNLSGINDLTAANLIATSSLVVNGTDIGTTVDLAGVPIGSIIPWYDFNGTLTLQSNYAYCDGSTIADAASPINGQILPDLSNRYLVGFGSEAGQDIDTATWDVTPVGNANHQVDLSHSHAVDPHDHGPGSLIFNIGTQTRLGGTENIYVIGYDVTGAVYTNGSFRLSTTGGGSGVNPTVAFVSSLPLSTTRSIYTTNTDSHGTTDTASPNTDSQLSATENVQPRSVRVRFIMRIK